MVTHVRKDPVIQPELKTCSLTRAAIRSTKIFLSAPRKGDEEEDDEEGEGGEKKLNSITQSKPTPCPPGVISAPFKSLITHKTNNILTPW